MEMNNGICPTDKHIVAAYFVQICQKYISLPLGRCSLHLHLLKRCMCKPIDQHIEIFPQMQVTRLWENSLQHWPRINASTSILSSKSQNPLNVTNPTFFQQNFRLRLCVCACRLTSSKQGSGCGSVGRAVASDTRGPRFDSSHRQKFIYTLNICILSTMY